MKTLLILSFVLISVSQSVMARETKGHQDKPIFPMIRELK